MAGAEKAPLSATAACRDVLSTSEVLTSEVEVRSRDLEDGVREDDAEWLEPFQAFVAEALLEVAERVTTHVAELRDPEARVEAYELNVCAPLGLLARLWLGEETEGREPILARLAAQEAARLEGVHVDLSAQAPTTPEKTFGLGDLALLATPKKGRR